MKKVVILTTLALSATTLVAKAQQGDQPGKPPRRPVPPLIAALDANHDGVIDADEIANAPAALKTLDKNGDGKLTRDELMPPRPQGGQGGQGIRRQRGPGGQGFGGQRGSGKRPPGPPPENRPDNTPPPPEE